MLYVLLIVLGNCISFSIETTITSVVTPSSSSSSSLLLSSPSTQPILNDNYDNDSLKLKNEENIKINFPFTTMGETTTVSPSSSSTPTTTTSFTISTVGTNFLSITEMTGNVTTTTTEILSPLSTIQSSLSIIEIDDDTNNSNNNNNDSFIEIYGNITIPNTILDYDQLNSIKIDGTNINHTDGFYENYDEMISSISYDQKYNQTASKRYRVESTAKTLKSLPSLSIPNRELNINYSMLLQQVTIAPPTDSSWPVRHSSVVEGDVIIGGLMMIHEREDTITCGPIMPQGGIQALEAMLYTLDSINTANLLPNITLGAHILDDCDKDTYGLEMAVDFIKG